MRSNIILKNVDIADQKQWLTAHAHECFFWLTAYPLEQPGWVYLCAIEFDPTMIIFVVEDDAQFSFLRDVTFRNKNITWYFAPIDDVDLVTDSTDPSPTLEVITCTSSN